MLSFFPNPYPDELLYSVLARYHVRSGNTSPKITLRELFGKEVATAIVDLPCNLAALTKRLSDFSNYTYLDFIYNNTLFPFYAPFIPEERATLILKAMKSNNGSSINTRIGIMANTVQNSVYLRFCPLCLQEDITSYGEAYWHRVHQIPGVVLCTKHNIPILDSLVHWHEMNKHEYIAADEANCKAYPYKLAFNAVVIEKLSKLYQGAAWILNARLKSKGISWFYEGYKYILINKGYATPNGKVHQEALLKDFYQFYEPEVLKLTQAEINIDSQENWLSSIVRKPRKIFYPIKHMLVINFLQLSVQEFFHEKYAYNPFGASPWPCLNKASKHYHQEVIKEVLITYDNKAKQPVGTFTCNCGFIYSRRGPDNSKLDRYKIGRIKEFGLLWEEKLKELSLNAKLSFREIARRLNVDTNTVIKYIRNGMGKADEEKRNEVEKEAQGSRNKYREKWLKLRNENPESTKTQLRQLDNSIFEWLYKKDREWFDENSPKTKHKISVSQRIDWNQRDSELLNKASKIVKALLATDRKPERITIGRIGKLIGAKALLEKHIDKLPLTNQYLRSVLENIEEYQIRRLKWATKELLNNAEPLKAWAIRRKAGLKTNCSDCVERAIEDEIDFYMNNKEVR